MKSYLIVIPAYNEEEHIAGVLDDVKKSNPTADILVVNDGSSDKTSELSRQKGVMVLDIPFNIGYGGAVQTGFRFATEEGYDFVITLDGDAQHDPASVQNLIEAREREGADVIIGSRFLGAPYSMDTARRIGVFIFSRIARLYTGITFTDPTSGFLLLNRTVFSYLSAGDNYPLDYPDVNIIMALHKKKFKVREAPVRMVEKRQGKSMHSGLRPLVYVARMFLAILMVLLRKED
ncbi:MAG TPA: glycosyltransferase family 2 protein [Thermodesulfovibrionales bacterium]|nr:glycosyltransferase family 2 protein [Thermodesulfovibrionales bacterium]